MDEIVSLCKRRGFIFRSSEIYGGLAGAWDYGPLGVEMKNNIKRAWWKSVVQERDDMVGMDAAILMHPRVWEASGHVETFADPMVDCRNCQSRLRADEIEGDTCPVCGVVGQFTEPRMFNLLLRTFVGPVEEEASVVYLRPETAQGMFVNFGNVLATTRRKLPFGMAQIGKSFRNEVTPRHFVFRTREFEQMEIEYFVRPEEAPRWHEYWMEERLRWYLDLGIRRENLRLKAHAPEELAHYAAACSDVEYNFPMGWLELEGIANRTDYDLKRHSEFSGESLTYFDEEKGEHIFPHIIEPSAGVDRPLLAFIVDAYDEEEVRGERRVLLRLHPRLAPVKVAVLPLSRNEKLVPTAREVWSLLRPHFMTQYDDAQSIGRRYRRQDEIGTPYCVTVDFDTLEDRAVTIRERDSMDQVRVPISGLVEALKERLPVC
ncbi:MAG: glycine--tRNA ligase [Dehalococcoidia bacterium]|nr:glycine--tRNA ligase [Dehalococcoidia bacterium]